MSKKIIDLCLIEQKGLLLIRNESCVIFRVNTGELDLEKTSSHSFGDYFIIQDVCLAQLATLDFRFST